MRPRHELRVTNCLAEEITTVYKYSSAVRTVLPFASVETVIFEISSRYQRDTRERYPSEDSKGTQTRQSQTLIIVVKSKRNKKKRGNPPAEAHHQTRVLRAQLDSSALPAQIFIPATRTAGIPDNRKNVRLIHDVGFY